MIEVVKKEHCSGCHACKNICPKGCIEMEADEEGFYYPRVNGAECVECGLCEKVCPIKKENKIKTDPQAYACINKNEEERGKSSSGGMFTLLAEYVISKGGIVYGAAWNGEFQVEHRRITRTEEISLLRSSKYMQSRIGNTYMNVKEDLEQGKLVYFSGTPCQIDGLCSYLQKGYEKLILQDIICHGAPSAKAWKSYLQEMNKKYKATPLAVNFRQKRTGWSTYELAITYPDREYHCYYAKDTYMKAFLQNLNLRPSCYECYSKSLRRQSDITLADFWGIDRIAPELNDNKGISLVLIHTEKATEILNALEPKILCKKVNIQQAISYNPSAIQSVTRPKVRDEFYQNIDTMAYTKLVKCALKKHAKYTKNTPVRKLLRKMKRLLGA